LTVANHLIIFEPHESPAVEAQAVARLVRMGSKHTTVLIHRLYLDGATIENARRSKRRKLECERGYEMLCTQGDLYREQDWVNEGGSAAAAAATTTADTDVDDDAAGPSGANEQGRD
jgi:hypothetical protein